MFWDTPKTAAARPRFALQGAEGGGRIVVYFVSLGGFNFNH